MPVFSVILREIKSRTSTRMLPQVHFFVYGTLKSGQCREKCWPVRPLEIRRAWIFGRLYDLGAYPALWVPLDRESSIQPEERVAGQLWSFHIDDFRELVGVLDVIEGTGQPGQPDEYYRLEMPVTILESGLPIMAQTYVYAQVGRLKSARLVAASFLWKDHSYAVWPADGHL